MGKGNKGVQVEKQGRGTSYLEFDISFHQKERQCAVQRDPF